MTATDRPYTDDDLRAEAASCLSALSVTPTVQDIRRSLPDTYVDSHRTEDGGATWGDLLTEDRLGTAVGEIHALIEGRADVSEWAINLGADGLEPSPNVLGMEAGDTPIVRIHLAFHPDMDDTARAEFAMKLGRLMADEI